GAKVRSLPRCAAQTTAGSDSRTAARARAAAAAAARSCRPSSTAAAPCHTRCDILRAHPLSPGAPTCAGPGTQPLPLREHPESSPQSCSGRTPPVPPTVRASLLPGLTYDVLLGLCSASAVFLLPAGFPGMGLLNPEGYTALSLFPVRQEAWGRRMV